MSWDLERVERVNLVAEEIKRRGCTCGAVPFTVNEESSGEGPHVTSIHTDECPISRAAHARSN